ncbi:hypothetical protein C8D97_10675 [Pleionea mediterranea]|uniref:PH domain-containing protein n=2 Tax=Pleionea mediterranea TaxID=523701 RepID=A0A316FPS2_9GAMM|nr:hypothetical protein C8D97_10675 [Pleionea mediterranea]
MLLYLGLCISLPFVFEYIYEEKDIFDFTIRLSVIFFVLLCVPPMVLFFRYAIVNNSLEIAYKSNDIELLLNGKKRIVKLNEIEHIEIKLTFPTYFSGIRYLATDSFLYAVIYLHSKESFTVTSLLDNELFDTKAFFNGRVDIFRKLRFVCWPPGQNLHFSQ